MEVILKSIDCMHHDPYTYNPEKDDVAITLSLSIGLAASDGSDYFDLFVCTPEWLCKHQWEPELIRHMLILREYDLDEITEIINKCIEKCTCNTWLETAQKLSRYFAWEFEDYQP